MNESKDIKDIEALYKTLLENADNKVWKDGDCPEALGDSPHAKGEEPTQDKAEGFTPAIEPGDDKDNDYYMNKISERLKENNQKVEKNGASQINNSVTMSKKSDNNIFNKLYSTIMEGDDPFEDLGGMEAELGDDGDLDIGRDEEGGDEVTVTLPRDVAQQLCDMLKDQLDDGMEDDMEDDMGDDMGGDEDFLEDAVKSEPEPKEHGDAHGHGMIGGSNKVAASGYNANTGAAANKGDAKADEEPKELGHGGDMSHPEAGKVSSGSNKVKTNNKAPLE